MKRGILIMLVISSLMLLMLGVGVAGGEHAHSLCLVSLSKQAPCPAEGVVASAIFHLSGMKAFWTVSLLAESLMLLLLVLFALLLPPFLLQSEEQQHISVLQKETPVSKGTPLFWLSLLWHSPTSL
ncbi:MAG: hypothetical protein Q8P71_00715 [bacterium]|nr:hypothetical protein [bacterium]